MKIKLGRTLGAALCAALYVGASAVPARAALRVEISSHQLQAVFASESGLLVRRADSPDSAPLLEPQLVPVVDVHPLGNGLLLTGAVSAGNGVTIAPVGDSPLMINGRPYRGGAIVRRDGDATLSVVSVVELEQYLYGVVPSEMSPSWPQAALQAQAIVARTYAAAHAHARRNEPFDIRASEQDQAYKGIDAEMPAASDAVDTTRDTVLAYQGEIIHAYYSACDGGYTADGSELNDPQPYLSATKDPYAVSSPHMHWTARLPLASLAASLRPRFGDLGSIRSIAAGGTDMSGRLQTITLSGSLATRTVPANLFRALLGTHVVKSTRIQAIALDQGALQMSGSGYGHGVGLSQWGARQMAASGMTVQDILRFYYQGTALVKMPPLSVASKIEERSRHPVSHR